MKKFNHEHTCTCKLPIVKHDTTTIIGCDFKCKNTPGFKGYLWFASDCCICGNTVLSGRSYCTYNAIQEGLLFSALKEAGQYLNQTAYNLLLTQFYGKRYFISKWLYKEKVLNN